MEQKRPAARVQQGFLHGAFILMFGVLLVKAIGALFKIPLSSIITEDGMGYFSTAYSFFNVLFSLSTVGFPVAVARLTAAEDALGHFRDVRQIKAAALPVFSVIGVLCALLMASFAPLYTHLVQSPGALFSMLALAPCAALCSISSVYRGYFEGLRNMLPTARSQVAESLGKLIFGLSGAIFVMHMGARELQASGTVFGCTVKSEADGCQLVCALGAAAAILGVTLGAVLGLLTLVFQSRRDGVTKAMLQRAPKPKSKRIWAGKLLRTALPISLGAVAMSFSGLIDASFLQTRVAYAVQTDPAALLSMYAGAIPRESRRAGNRAELPFRLLQYGADPLFARAKRNAVVRGQRAAERDTGIPDGGFAETEAHRGSGAAYYVFDGTADGGGAFRFGAARRTADLRCTAGHGHRGARADDLGRGVRFCGAVRAAEQHLAGDGPCGAHWVMRKSRARLHARRCAACERAWRRCRYARVLCAHKCTGMHCDTAYCRRENRFLFHF